MVKSALSHLWRRLPKGVRRRFVVLLNQRFTVAAAAAVFDDRGRVLLLRHRFRTGSGWGLPGGFLNAGEQPEDAVRRELLEEVGLELVDLELVQIRTLRGANQVEALYHARPGGAAAVRAHYEVAELAWFSLDNLPEGLSADQRRLVRLATERREGALPDASAPP
jgi:8-oxo-dGTP diphosphatase